MVNVTQTKETLALNFSALGSWISLHTASPGQSGASEATGGSPAYARKQTTWTGAAVDGVVTGSKVTLDVPAGTYTHVGIWSAATGGTCIDWYAITPSATDTVQFQVGVTPTITIP